MMPLEIIEVLHDVDYRGWVFDLDYVGHKLTLQVRFDSPDARTGKMVPQSGRKWLLSEHMTRSEIVYTALKAVLTAEEHEAREHFRYRGAPIFGPHIDVGALWASCVQLDARPANDLGAYEAMSR